jgi:hypothetical protein
MHILYIIIVQESFLSSERGEKLKEGWKRREDRVLPWQPGFRLAWSRSCRTMGGINFKK